MSTQFLPPMKTEMRFESTSFSLVPFDRTMCRFWRENDSELQVSLYDYMVRRAIVCLAGSNMDMDRQVHCVAVSQTAYTILMLAIVWVVCWGRNTQPIDGNQWYKQRGTIAITKIVAKTNESNHNQFTQHERGEGRAEWCNK